MIVELFRGNYNISKRTVILDCDEVLVETSPHAVQLMHTPEYRDVFDKYLRLSPEFDLEQMTPLINSRPTYYLNEWLMKKEIVNDDMFEGYQKECIPTLMEVYARSDFYENLLPTRLGITIARMLKNGMIRKAVVVSKLTEYSDKGKASKERFLKKLFAGSMDKVDIYYLRETDKKSDVINSLTTEVLNDVSFFADDHVPNIVDVLENTSLTNYQLLIPSYGYNTDISSVNDASLRTKHSKLSFYSPLD